MADPATLAGPPGWVVSAFSYAVGRADRSSVVDAQIRTANQAGYTRAAGYTTRQQVAIGGGLRMQDAIAVGQGGGPGGDRAGPPGPRGLAPVPSAGPDYLPPTRDDAFGEPWTEPPQLPYEEPRGDWQPPADPNRVEEGTDDWYENDEMGPIGGDPNPYIQTLAPSPGYFPDVMPQTLPGRVVRALPGVFGRVGGVIGAIFWPSEIGDDPWYPYGVPEPIPKGPPGRRRRPPIESPDADDWYNWGPEDFPPKPGRTILPDDPQPYGVPEPDRDTRPAPVPRGDPWAVPGTRPGTRPGTLPRTPPTSWPDLWPYIVPFLMPRPVPGTPTGRPSRLPDNPFGPDPLTPTRPAGVDLPQPFSVPQPYRADPCNCAAQDTERKRKRKKDSCTNPISSKRTFSRGGSRYRTVTRKLKCPASSRKKPR